MARRYTANNYWKFTKVGPKEYGDFAYVSDYHLGAEERARVLELSYYNGTPLDPADIAAVRLWVVPDKEMEDRLDNPLGWQIISDRFIKLLRDCKVEDRYELLPAPLFDEKTKEPIPGYQILNPLAFVDCLDPQRSKAFYYDDAGKWLPDGPQPGVPGEWRVQGQYTYLHRAKIPANAKLFRLEEFPRFIIMRGDVVAEYYKRKMTGAWFMHLPTEEEEYIDNEQE